MNFFSALFVCSFFRLLLLFFSTLLRLDKTFVQKHWGAQMDSELNNILGKSINFTYCLYYWQYLFKENTPIFFRGGQRPRISVVRLFSTDKILRVTFCIKSFLTWEGGAYLSWCAIGSLFQKRDFVFQVWGGGHTWRRCRDRARRGGGEGRGAEVFFLQRTFDFLFERTHSRRRTLSETWHLQNSYWIFSHLWSSNLKSEDYRRKKMCPVWGSNSRPSDYETDALPTALTRQDTLIHFNIINRWIICT